MPDHATTEAASAADDTTADHPAAGNPDTDDAADSPPVDLGELRHEIDYLDAEILRLVQRRTAVSKAIGKARRAAGGPRVVHGREMAVLDRYRELGPEGHELAMLLLRLGRGRLGR